MVGPLVPARPRPPVPQSAGPKVDAGRYGLPHGLSGVTTQDAQRLLLERMTELTATVNRLVPLMEQIDDHLQRETSLDVLSFDTNSAPLTNGQGVRVDCVRQFGAPLNSIFVESVGGGSLQVRVNGSPWVALSAADEFSNMRINEFDLRVTTGAAGTAILIVAWVAGVKP